MAIVLDGSLPDSETDGLPGQATHARFAGRLKRNSLVPAPVPGDYSAANVATNQLLPRVEFARPESAAPPQKETKNPGTAAEIEQRLVKESFARIVSAGPAVMEYFYARLFTVSPRTRSLFPMSMTAQRERVFAALARLIWSLDDPPRRTEILSRLGRDHRRFGVTEAHYAPFMATLRDTAEHFSGSEWTPQTASAWQATLDYVAGTMRAAAEDDARTSPPWWTAEIVSHELRSPGVAVLRLRPSQPLPYQAGQYVPVQVTRWPRIWRPYSIATAPRPGGLIELHVRAVPGGLVSNTLVHHSDVGDCVLLGAADGRMTLAESDRDLLCVAGGTGLAPIKAIIEQALARQTPGRPRKITLFFGTRQHFDLYDLEDLQLLESACSSLRVIPVLSDEPGYGGLVGTLPDVVGNLGLFEDAEAYVCGPAAMVTRTTALLAASIPEGQLHYDPLS
ncbi:MAG TPA: globin domain-containing protein [Streptosporangiaceae bacterium]|jgi:NAD(P)H-flavin reductase